MSAEARDGATVVALDRLVRDAIGLPAIRFE
jgi:hypothetical protein